MPLYVIINNTNFTRTNLQKSFAIKTGKFNKIQDNFTNIFLPLITKMSISIAYTS